VNSAPPPEKEPPWKNPFSYSGIVLTSVAFYVAFVLLTRYECNRDFERRDAEQKAEKRRADDHAPSNSWGARNRPSGRSSVSPPLIHHGEKSELCYDVANAKTVALDPPDGQVWPSHSRSRGAFSPKNHHVYPHNP
jgi:hypothetical protein